MLIADNGLHPFPKRLSCRIDRRDHYLPLFHALVIMLALLTGFLSVASAQPSGAQGNDFLYKAVKDDTLIGLAQTFTGDAQHWRTLQSLNQVDDPTKLPIGKVIRIPFALIPQLPAHATVLHISGEAWLDQQRLAPDMSVAEGAVIRTGANGFVTLRLTDDSIITIPSNASAALSRLRVFRNTPLTDTIIQIDSGSLETEVAPNKAGVGRFEVRTPVSITGVRGTRLRVHASADGSRSEVIEGVAHLQAHSRQTAELSANHGAAVGRNGQLLGVSALLAAPQLPEISPDDAAGHIAFPAVPSAHGYLVRIALDAQGQQLISSRHVTEPVAAYQRQSKPGYLLVRALDANGIGGLDAVVAIPAGRVLSLSDGSPVRSGQAGAVRLIDY